MIIGTGTIYLHANWVHSLKEKRMIVKSIVDKVKHRFNVSIAEISEHDTHQTIVLGFATVSNHTKHADEVVQTVLAYIEENTEANVQHLETEII